LDRPDGAVPRFIKNEPLRLRIANQFDLKVVNGKIPIPDLRVEYEDDCREVRRLDLEIATATKRRKSAGHSNNRFGQRMARCCEAIS
jgi:hypothetical protein